MSDPRIKIKLAIQRVGNEITALLAFSNQTRQELFLERRAIYLGDDKMSDRFVIQRGTEPVDYKAMYINYPSLEQKDYVNLPPEDSVHTAVRLDELYAFDGEPGAYTLRYETFSTDLQRPDDLYELTSNEVTLHVPDPSKDAEAAKAEEVIGAEDTASAATANSANSIHSAHGDQR